MANPLLIVHGWSDRYTSFMRLAGLMQTYGYQAKEVYLGAYESMHDDVTFDDLAEGLDTQLRDLAATGTISLEPFSLDAIVHSTGGPVVRHWLAGYVKREQKCPLRSLVMLAPANFGSRLAGQGKTTLAKLFKGGVHNGFETGRQILEGLEVGSPFLWNLAERDLFGAALYPVARDRGPFVFVLSGTSTYGALKGLVARGANENGSDGTIRAAAASLDSVRLNADFTRPGKPSVTAQRQLNGPIAFKLVPDKNHTEIVPDRAEHEVLPVIDRCLRVTDAASYAQVIADFDQANAAFYAGQTADDGIRRFQQFVMRVRDDFGNDVDDYRLDFHVVDSTAQTSTWTDGPPAALTKYQAYTTRLQEHVICDVRPHSVHPAYRTFFVNLDELEKLRGDLQEHAPEAFIALNLDAMPAARGVTYRTDDLHYVSLEGTFAANGNGVTFFAPSTSTLVDITLKLSPTTDIFGIYRSDGQTAQLLGREKAND